MPLFSISSILYGLFLISSGAYRFYIADSKNALWFGLVMGVLAITAGVLSLKPERKFPYYLQSVVVIFVGGFFIKKLMGELEGDSLLRVISLITFSAIMATFIAIGLKNKK